MKKMLLLAAIAVVLVATAAAQGFSYDAAQYQVSYFANQGNTAGYDQTTTIVNPGGALGTPLTGMAGAPASTGALEGTICANIYVFDARQEMQECCSCPITANGILQLSLRTNLLNHPLTGTPGPAAGVIKIVASAPEDFAAGTCGGEATITTGQGGVLAPWIALTAWQTHLQAPAAGSLVVTEDGFKSAFLDCDPSGNASDSERAFLATACSFVQYLGSGAGVCTCPATS